MAYTLRIDDKISLELQFEALLSQKIIYLKKDGEKPQKIGLNIEVIQSIVDLSGEIYQIVERFSDGSVVICKRYQLSNDIFLQLNTCGNGMAIDIRRYCCINEELIPMRVGVNIKSDVLRPLMNGLIEMLEEAVSM
ncbi:hypothetical protein ACF0H5_015360 [Mactra antiquata]